MREWQLTGSPKKPGATEPDFGYLQTGSS